MFSLFKRLTSSSTTQAPSYQAPTPPVTVPLRPPHRTRQASITSAADIAGAFNTGTADEVQDYMSRHLIQMANPMLMSRAQKDALSTASQFTVKEAKGTSDYRHIGDNKYRQIKTFELFPVLPLQIPIQPTIGANFFPMTRKGTAWEQNTGAVAKMDAIQYTSQTAKWAGSTKFTGCLALRTEKGQLAHVQPTTTQFARDAVAQQSSVIRQQSTVIQKAASMLSNADSQHVLEEQSSVAQVFGPKEYGKFAQGRDHNRTNVMVHQTATGDATLFHQSLFAVENVDSRTPGGGTETWHNRTLDSGHTAFGSSRPSPQQSRRKSLTSMLQPPSYPAPLPPGQQPQAQATTTRRRTKSL